MQWVLKELGLCLFMTAVLMGNMNYIITPQGNLINLLGGATPVLASNAITWNQAGSVIVTETYTTPYQASYVLSVIRNALVSNKPINPDFSNLDLSSYGLPQITSIQPTSFDILTNVISIYGIGFDPTTLGLLYLDDAGGGQDRNGYNMKCASVSPTQMTAVFNTAGDGALGPGGVLIYYIPTGGGGIISNVINATNPSGTLITIP